MRIMMRRSWYVFSKIPTVVKYTLFGFLASKVTHDGYEGYKLSSTPSPYQLAASRMNFSNNQEQEALLKTFSFAGYFKPESLWNDIVLMNFKDPNAVFVSVMKSIAKASNGNKIDSHILRKNLFDGLSEKDAMDFILYLGQKAFDRKEGQERYQLEERNWMEQHKQEYIKAARILGLYDTILPKYQNYDEAWIAGASRIGIMTRLLDYNHQLHSIKINGKTLILAGARPLWAEIDGIAPIALETLENALTRQISVEDLPKEVLDNQQGDVNEGKSYMAALADRNNIALNPASPFIKYSSLASCPKGLLPGRTYPNILDNGALTETIMANDLLRRYVKNEAAIEIIDTKSLNNKRPDTASTAKDAAAELIAKIQKGEYPDKTEFVIYFQSNQPFVERQTIVTQRETNKALKESGINNVQIKIDGAGFANKGVKIMTIHSELGALIYERYKDASPESSRDIKDLLFTTRSHEMNTNIMPEVPESGYEDGLVGIFHYFFDSFAE